MGWFFSRKKEGVSKREFKELINSMKASFANVKEDISSISEKTNNYETKIEEIQNVLSYLNESLETMNNKITTIEPARQSIPITQDFFDDIDEEKLPERSQKFAAQRLWDDLTEIQRSLVVNLRALMNEGGREWISMKQLSQETYPDKSYPKIKAMISNYTDILFEQGFIEKKRRRRETFLTTTNKSKHILPKKPIKVKVNKG